mgnify:CR=1 FL=1
MATFRGSNHQVGASAVWTNGDLANLINNLYRQSIRAGATGDYARGLRDMAQSIAAATNTEIDLPYAAPVHPVHPVYSENITERYERIEERRERTVERYAPPLTPPAERQFKIVGEREPWPAPASTPSIQSTAAAAANMTGDDVNITVFNPAAGRLVSRDIGHGWIGNDGYTAYWNASDWQRITVDEARAWGNLIPDNWAVLVRHAYADRMRRQLAAPHASRITHQDRRLR